MKKCCQCNKEIKKPVQKKYNNQWKKRKFCSLKCSSISQRRKKLHTFICEICNKNFEDKYWRYRKFCCRKCFSVFLSKKYFGKKPSKQTLLKLKKSHTGKINELSSNWKGGISKIPGYASLTKRKLLYKTVGFHTQKEWEILKVQYGFTCLCCKKQEPEIKLTQDHIIPISKGGSDFIENIQPLCLKCNMTKSAKIIKYG